MSKKIARCAMLFLLFLSVNVKAQPDADQSNTIKSLFKMLDTYQVQPPVRNAELSNHIFNQFIKALDPFGLFFTGESIEAYRPLRDSLCSTNFESTASFVNQLTKQYKSRVHLADSLLELACQTSFNLKIKDSMSINTDDKNFYPKTDKELQIKWKKWMQYGLLKSVVSANNNELLKSTQVLPDSLFSANSLALKKTRIKEKRWLNTHLNHSEGVEVYVMKTFLNCIANCYDPHSNYFTARDEEKFESSLSVDNYAFGFSLGNNLNNEVIISAISPGSPLWYSKQLEKGDVILKLKMEGQEETDLAFASFEEVNEFFDNFNGDKVDMTVRKTNGSVVTLELNKGKFDNKVNQTMGFILKGEKNAGYIRFSSFYEKFNQYGKGCSIDFLKELFKLKETGIEGLIIDLRNNPGGSEYETMEIATFLAGNGFSAIVSNKMKEQILLKHQDTKKWDDNPVIVLVNGASASGAELLSAILQDYNRAVIVGTPTFGKGTEQLIFPIRRNYNGQTILRKPENIDFAKITSGKIYRITGKSYQKSGITPDISLPDLNPISQMRERDMPFALENDQIKPIVQFTPFRPLPIDSLAQLSRKRVVQNENFSKIELLGKQIEQSFNPKKALPVDLNGFKKDAKLKQQLISEIIDVDSVGNKNFKAEFSSFAVKEMQSDSLSFELNKRFRNSIQNDVYVGEAYSILMDLIKK
jgi:carboxyl-terminal processing protease